MAANAFTLTATIGGTMTAATITLSRTSVTFPSTADAGSYVATITVTPAGGGTYSGTLVLGGTDAAKFALSNGGVYPCNLMVGPVDIPGGPTVYNVSITAP